MKITVYFSVSRVATRDWIKASVTHQFKARLEVGSSYRDHQGPLPAPETWQGEEEDWHAVEVWTSQISKESCLFEHRKQKALNIANQEETNQGRPPVQHRPRSG